MVRADADTHTTPGRNPVRADQDMVERKPHGAEQSGPGRLLAVARTRIPQAGRTQQPSEGLRPWRGIQIAEEHEGPRPLSADARQLRELSVSKTGDKGRQGWMGMRHQQLNEFSIDPHSSQECGMMGIAT